MVREELFESVLEVKRVSDRLMAMKLQVKRIDTKHSKCLCSLGWQQHGGKKRFLARSGWIDKKCIKTEGDSARWRPKWTCGQRKHRG